MALNREKRILRAKLLLTKAQKDIEPYQKKLDAAQTELWSAEKSFDEGERVRVTETCKRGCCVECEFTGTIVGLTPNGRWDVMSDKSGQIYGSVYEGDIKRL